MGTTAGAGDGASRGWAVRAGVAKGRDGAGPAGKRLLEAGRRLAPDIIAVLLAGMGEDGARGRKSLKDRGAYTLVQDQATSLVYGMPRVAFQAGAAVEELAISRMGPRLLALAHGAMGLG